MTLLLASWLMFAPIFIALRWALLPGRPTFSRSNIGSTRRLAAGLRLSLRLIDAAYAHAARAAELGREEDRRRMLSCARDAARGLLNSLGANMASWRKVAGTLASAPSLAPLPLAQIRVPCLRPLAWADAAGDLVLPNAVARLRLRLFVLRAMVVALRWTLPRNVRSQGPAWRDHAATRADLSLLVSHARHSHGALRRASAGRAPRRRYA